MTTFLTAARTDQEKVSHDMHRLRLFSGTANPALAREIAAYLGVPDGPRICKRFADGELQRLGSPVAVGERLSRDVIAPEGSGREAELVKAQQREESGHIFYDLEYAVHLQDRERHELATVVVDRGRLYTLAASTNEIRWNKVRSLFERVITSFTFLV